MNTWTDEQWRAISCRGKNTLITAGAGSGKTRVLVERVLQRITEKDNPVEIDKLLVVTFTNAAASEMKQRIGAALENALKENPRHTHLRRQLLLLNRAAISTVHSFCMDVIRRYYYLRDLDPSFRILDETEADLMRQEILEEILEEYYEKEEVESPFYRLVDIYSSDQGDNALQELVQRLYDFSRSNLQPEAWLGEKAAAFIIDGENELACTPWAISLLQDCRMELEGMLERLYDALEIASGPDGPEPYIQNLEEDINTLTAARDASENSWGELFDAMQSPAFSRLKACRGDRYDQDLKDRAVQIRDGCKKDFKGLKEALFQRPLREQGEELKKLAPLLLTLTQILQAFEERYRQAKEEKGAADFSDLEHYALQILSSPESTGETVLPSVAALEYREKFAEVFVDEYQDINLVQEAIIKLVSSPEPGGNLFMVGDVKQSIYRFRLAEPELFLQKYRGYNSGLIPGECIALTNNFRSRREVLAGVNFLFCQIMDEPVGEIEYDGDARLLYGASYPTMFSEGGENPFAVDVLLIDRSGSSANNGDDEDALGEAEDIPHGEGEEEESRQAEAEEDWEKAGLEGRLIARKIRELMGKEGGQPFSLYDKKAKKERPVTYRDIVILLRTAQNWVSPIMEELRQAGIPAYAELGTGYFEAVEVEVMLSLLKIVDNPYQDIPLAGVLRSPLVSLDAVEMAHIRTAAPGKNYYDALQEYCRLPEDEEFSSGEKGSSLRERLKLFLDQLTAWQDEARQGSLADLIWRIYSDSGYFDLVGSMPGGSQRQANLRALYDRARQYESTSFRGLFRFLRFIEKLKDRGGDLGAARALGEQEDVVRIMTVHKSKGLEFPVVIAAGLSKQFNMQDLRQGFLLHKELGFGPKYVDTKLRITYPTLPWMALKKRIRRELLAEEMRILYVALTRAEEKLILVGTVKNIAAEVQKWQKAVRGQEQFLAPGHRFGALSYLDWIGPALLRHFQCRSLREMLEEPGSVSCLAEEEPSSWSLSVISSRDVINAGLETSAAQETEVGSLWEQVSALAPVPTSGAFIEEVERRLSWRYSHEPAETHFAKLSVSELKKLHAAGLSGDDSREAPWFSFLPSVGPRPQFLGEKSLSAAERGSAYHAVMQHLNLEKEGPINFENVLRQMEEMVIRGQLTKQEKEAVDPEATAAFFETPMGLRMLRAEDVRREVPFSMVLPASEVYFGKQMEELVLVQGVIDCLVREEDGFVIIDYKTDRTAGIEAEELVERYRLQIELYSRAVEMILKEKVKEKYLYFFHNRQLLEVKN
ncbi:MAG: helicase-exonuclease AddAB subunit AddA [Bacillota bacterium]|nr:helicase-exonuclease AddAB subunit AddA [Bacillota bacterium]